MKRWISAILHKTPATAPQREAAVAPPAALHPDDDFFGAEDINGAAPVPDTPLLTAEDAPVSQVLANILVPAESAAGPANDPGSGPWAMPDSSPEGAPRFPDTVADQDDAASVVFSDAIPPDIPADVTCDDDVADVLFAPDDAEGFADDDPWSDLDAYADHSALRQMDASADDGMDWTESENDTTPVPEQDWQIDKKAQQLALLLPFTRRADRDAGVEKLRGLLEDFPASTSFRAMSDLAVCGATLDDLLAVAELKRFWALSPDLWLCRRYDRQLGVS